MADAAMRAGLVAIVGRPNVGKSSLLNAFVGKKVSIVTPKPQTTRWRVLGIRNEPATQLVFVDTPGLHRDTPRAVNRMMNKTATGALSGVDVVLFVVHAGRWTEDDDHALAALTASGPPQGGGPFSNVIAVVNQIDRLRGRDQMIPYLQELEGRGPFAAIVPVSAMTGENLDHLLDEVRARLPESPALYPIDQVSDRDDRWHVAELIREQLMLRLEQEVPYSIAVTIDRFEQDGGLTRIAATIWVERSGQQPIVVGKGGALLKEVGRAARLELEARWQRKVFLQLWVKVRERWTDDQRELRALGLDEA